MVFFFFFLLQIFKSIFLSSSPFSVFLAQLFKSCVHLTRSLIHSLSLPSLSSVFPPCRCCVIGVIFIPVSPWLWPLDGWIFTFFTHWWPFPVAALGAPVSLLLCCWQTTACKSHMDTANGTQGVRDRGFRDWRKVEKESGHERETVVTRADCQLSDWKWFEETEVLKVYLHLQRYGLKWCNLLPLVSSWLWFPVSADGLQ